MNKTLVIVFVKTIELGKVKTRLALSIGNHAAVEVYNELIKETEIATQNLNADIRIYYSNTISEDYWKGSYKAIQKGSNLGERMLNAFKTGFEDGYKRIVLIGSDLPDISTTVINNALNALNTSEAVFGPAEDGGYYLIGLSKMHDFIFNNKPWSQHHLLEDTLNELHSKHIKFSTLVTLNDIDTYEDLLASNFYKLNPTLQEKIKQLHD